jgi:hypothetical protein
MKGKFWKKQINGWRCRSLGDDPEAMQNTCSFCLICQEGLQGHMTEILKSRY